MALDITDRKSSALARAARRLPYPRLAPGRVGCARHPMPSQCEAENARRCEAGGARKIYQRGPFSKRPWTIAKVEGWGAVKNIGGGCGMRDGKTLVR
jgi:hypothetical protein